MRKKVTKLHCDYCDAQIEKSTRSIGIMIGMKTVGGETKQLEVGIKLANTARRRFVGDICRSCVFKAVQAVLAEEYEVEAAKELAEYEETSQE